MSESDSDKQRGLQETIESFRRQLRRLTVAVVLMTLVLVVFTVVFYGDLANYFSLDSTLVGSTAIGAAFIGFAFGWFARGRR